MKLTTLLNRVTNPPSLKESTLDERGIQGVLEDSFVKTVAKV
jgi:hypothetical protein